LFVFPLIIVWISQILSKIQEIQTTKKKFFYCLDFTDFCLDLALFVWISPVLNFLGRQQSKHKMFFIWISRIFIWISPIDPYDYREANRGTQYLIYSYRVIKKKLFLLFFFMNRIGNRAYDFASHQN
jgi:hypothetical protein